VDGHRVAALGLPAANATLRAHRLAWCKELAVPTLVVHGVLVTWRIAPFNLRRAFAILRR
jgi:hypothetical protein